MENYNKPIYPQIGSNTNSQHQLSEIWTDEENSGLTKREYFAALAMQGIISNPNYTSHSIGFKINHALNLTDELLKQLDRKNDNLLQKDNNVS